jgi:hypothetical protein
VSAGVFAAILAQRRDAARILLDDLIELEAHGHPWESVTAKPG